ncbi:MAG: Flp pilus assembly protein CpaB [Actinomycetota bacterium]
MTYRLRNIVIAVVLAAFAALLTMMYVTSYEKRVQNGEEDVSVLVATSDIPAGISGAAAMARVEERMVAQRNVAPGAVSEKSQLEEFVVSQPIYAGEQVSRQRFSSSSEIGVRSSLTGNMRAVALSGDGVQLLADTLRAGDRVDLVASLKISEDKDASATRIVLRDIEVLKPAGATGNKRLDNAAGRDQLSVLLAVSDTQVQKLFHVQRHGEWTLQLRPVVDAVDSPESLETNSTILRDGLRGGQGGN